MTNTPSTPVKAARSASTVGEIRQHDLAACRPRRRLGAIAQHGAQGMTVRVQRPARQRRRLGR
jgi:hypothetical protein